MRDYARLCEGTQKYASLASVCEAPFYARYVSSHVRKYALTPLIFIFYHHILNLKTPSFVGKFQIYYNTITTS